MKQFSAKVLLEGLASVEWLSAKEVSLVTTDSREIIKDCVFVAFPGERFDGHDFAAKALEQGAMYVVVNHPMPELAPERQIVCEDSYRAMLAIGANYRKQFSPCVIGVTGSVGKTTTKEFCNAVFSASGSTIKTLGNQNNELGVPRTLMRITDEIDYAVVEMGMNHAGEISRLTHCAKPDAAIITGIGVAHIENLGNREGILKAKLEICEGMSEGAPIALPYQDEYLQSACLPSHVVPVWFGVETPQADVFATDIVSDEEGETFTICDVKYGNFRVRIPTLGKHNIADALAAYSVATRLQLDPTTVAAALEHFQQTGMRQKVVKHGGVTVIEDCYNANPDSMAAALTMFEQYPCKHKVALLADMLELGAYSEQAHLEVGKLVAKHQISYLVTYGEAGALIAKAAQERGVTAQHTETHAQAAQVLLHVMQEGDALLVKGSRGMALEEALKIFYAEQLK